MCSTTPKTHVGCEGDAARDAKGSEQDCRTPAHPMGGLARISRFEDAAYSRNSARAGKLVRADAARHMACVHNRTTDGICVHTCLQISPRGAGARHKERAQARVSLFSSLNTSTTNGGNQKKYRTCIFFSPLASSSSLSPSCSPFRAPSPDGGSGEEGGAP